MKIGSRLISDPDRFWAKVAKGEPNDCWLWIGWRNADGYGLIDDRPRTGVRRAHRVAYEFSIGPIPDGLQLDHLCRNPPCVNPRHLEPVTNQENTRRGAHGSLITSCPKGHPYDDANTYVDPDGARRCRRCHRERMRRQGE